MCFNHLSPLPIILQSSPSPHNHCPFYKRSISGGLNYAKELWMPTFKSQQDLKKRKKIHTPINLRVNLCTSSFKVQKATNQNFGTLQMKTSPAAGGHHQSWSISDDSLRRYVQHASESCIQELLMSASVSIPSVSEPNKLGNGGDGWKILTLENGVEISKRRTGSLHIFRSRWVLRSISPQQFITVANAIDAAKQWDSELVEARYIKDLEDNLSIIRLRFGDNSKPLFRKREFIVYERRETMKDGTLVVAVASLPKEIAAGLLPQQNNAIRGLLLQSGWVVEKLEDINSCIVTYVVQLDPAGWLPKWFVNRLNTKLVMIIENLRKLVQTTAPHSS